MIINNETLLSFLIISPSQIYDGDHFYVEMIDNLFLEFAEIYTLDLNKNDD